MNISMALILTILIFIYGYMVGALKYFPYKIIEAITVYFQEIFKKAPVPIMMVGYSDTAQKQEVDCMGLDKSKTMVILAYGQGNAANGAEEKYTPKHNVLNVFEGKFYKAVDPLLGATNINGSVWGKLGDKIIESGAYENVIISSIGVGGTPIVCWTVDGVGIGYKGRLFGNYHSRILEAESELKALGFPVTHIFWHQGESDTTSETTRTEYKERFLNMYESMRKHGITAPVYVAQASRYAKKTSTEIVQAQKELALENEGIYEGPNTDRIDSIDDRTEDGQRFSKTGLEKFADLWFTSLKQNNFK